VRGYLPLASESSRGLLDPNLEQESIRELTQRRANLILELKNYEENQRVAVAAAKATANQNVAGRGAALAAAVAAAASSTASGGGGGAASDVVGVIPAGTQLSTSLALNLGSDGKRVRNNVSMLELL